MYYINGFFLSQKITGIQRYSINLLNEFDNLPEKKFTVLVPFNAKYDPNKYKNIRFKKLPIFKGNLWEQITLPFYMFFKRKPLISFGTIAPILYPSYVVIHDIRFTSKESPENKKWLFKMRAVTRINIKRYKHIFTETEFMKESISSYYGLLDNKISVIYAGVNGKINNTQIKEDFFISVASNYKHKNLKYIDEVAKLNSKLNFVIIGEVEVPKDISPNVKYLGYIDDQSMNHFYSRAKGFIMPSLYEGFGLPIVEAMMMGCRLIFISDIPVFKELFEDKVNYFDPNNPSTFKDILENAIETTSEDVDYFVKKFNWKEVAKIMLSKVCDK
ncbi:MAG: glycosyltransferase family 4 protein [Acholeplasmataceae bacterium]